MTLLNAAHLSLRSDELAELAERRMPGGVNSTVRTRAPRIFFERGAGSHLWDVDGKHYLDYLLGQGPSILGHAAPAVQDYVASETRSGMLFGSQSPLEVAAAELFCRTLEWPEQVRFGSTGTESVQAALRLARAATGRRKIVRFEGHYHGWLDDMLIAPDDSGGFGPASRGQVASRIADSHILAWNDLDSLARTLRDPQNDVAAVITEPIMLNSGAIVPEPGYLANMRDLCDQTGTILIFDEVITGFRVGLRGASAMLCVQPDLAVYGKAMAGGWPVSALAGPESLMRLVTSGDVTVSGTFNGSVMGMAAVIATITTLIETDPYPTIEAHGRSAIKLVKAVADRHGLPLHVQGLPQAFHVSWGERARIRCFRDLLGQDVARYRSLVDRLAERGIWVSSRGIWYVSAAHTDRDLVLLEERLDLAMGDASKTWTP